MTEQAKRGPRQTKVGTVVSNKMDKTVVVAVARPAMNRLYLRQVRRTSRFHAHDETTQCSIGDTVQIVASRPLSKTKNWRVQSIVKRVGEI